MPEVTPSLNVSIDRSKHTVLVVDDNPVTRYATVRTLTAAGFMAKEADSGGEAIVSAASGVSAVVLDVNLPDINGFEVCRRLRQQPTTTAIPVVHLSAAFVSDTDKVAGLNAGADAYLIHPAEPALLIASVQALIRARMAEERVHRSEAKFRSIYDQAQSGIALIDAAGHFRDANPVMLRMLGRTADAVIGRSILEFVAPPDRTRVEALTSSVALNQESARDECQFLTPAGLPVHAELSVSLPVENDLRIVAVADISDRVALERERQALLDREQAARVAAEKHSRSKDDFVAVLSHELRNPLSAILMNVHQLGRQNPPEKFIKFIDAIQRNASTQARIISDILDVSRINSGKLSLELEWIDPAALIASSLDSMKPLADKRGIVLQVSDAPAGCMAYLDGARFQQIFWNILNNAIKFSNQDATVEVSLVLREGELILCVKDHGKGIDAAFIPRIFDKFAQTDLPGSRSAGGLGLGMSIVKHLVELHSGTVAVESPGLGQGTTVTVKLPQKIAAAADLAGGDSNDMYFLTGRKILLVEDDREAADLLVLILQDRGAQVQWACDAREGLLALAETGFDLIVSDIGLPGMDGHQLLRTVRSGAGRNARIPAIALTAFGRDSDKQTAAEAGFDIHLSKPLEPHRLLGAMKQLMA
ncbi:hypothetical protein RD110_14075 [Rhodoferax koreense]|uniref:histidine kinase n=1 Tax=Rhodoferax koreensis TaxID=1842727 RepID=A0A1P8K3W8_9BURK|nr:response regulator [Rhodoferax koreense]APW40692.1 hypothetical protein RD110_14075 [Rhodoferax koreense]